MRLLQCSQRHLNEDYIDVYGGYAMKLMKIQLELMQGLDRHRKGVNQTVEVRHLYIHTPGQDAVEITRPARKKKS